MSHSPSPALRAVLVEQGVDVLTPIWHRAAFYEQPGNNFPSAECVERAVRYVLRDPDNRFTYLGDMASGTITCQVPGCPDPHMFTRHPHDAAAMDALEAGHWDRYHRKAFGP